MIGDIVYSKARYIEKKNSEAIKRREAEIKMCVTFKLSCCAIDNKWGIWLDVGDDKLLVNPIELVCSIFKDDSYYMLDPQKKNIPGFFIVEVEKNPYRYLWTL